MSALPFHAAEHLWNLSFRNSRIYSTKDQQSDICGYDHFSVRMIIPYMPRKGKNMKKENNYTQADIFGIPASRESIIDILKDDESIYRRFCTLKEKQQDNILGFLSGERGLEVLLDSFFRKIFNPLDNKERMCSLLSALMGECVEDYTVIPREGTQMYEKCSLVIMDILVRLGDDRLVDVEMQKIGYRFPAQRSTCYASDLVMRQYNALRAEHGWDFNYDMIRPVSIFVIIESPSKEFGISPDYVHRRQVSYSSGIELSETVNITYFTLDRFQKSIENIVSPLDKWLAFFTYKKPKDIISLVNRYPEYLPLYHEISEFRKNPKEAVFMYSEALAVLDRNTELYMIEEMRQEKEVLSQEKEALSQEKDALSQEKEMLVKEKDALSQEVEHLEKCISEKNRELSEQSARLEEYEAKYGRL